MAEKHTFCDELAQAVADHLAGRTTLDELTKAHQGYSNARALMRDGEPKPDWDGTLVTMRLENPADPSQPMKLGDMVAQVVIDGQAMKMECPEFTLYGVCEDRGWFAGKWFIPRYRVGKPVEQPEPVSLEGPDPVLEPVTQDPATWNATPTVAPNPDPLDLKDWQTVPLMGHLPPGVYEAQGGADDNGRFVIKRIRAVRQPDMHPKPQGSFPNREHLQVGPRIGGLQYRQQSLRADLARLSLPPEPICTNPFSNRRCEDCRCDVAYWECEGAFYWPCQKDGRSSQTTEKLPVANPTNQEER